MKVDLIGVVGDLVVESSNLKSRAKGPHRSMQAKTFADRLLSKAERLDLAADIIGAVNDDPRVFEYMAKKLGWK